MTINRFALVVVPGTLMILVVIGMTGIEQWLSGFGKTEAARLAWGRAGIALPYVAGATIGVLLLFSSAGSISIKQAGWGVVAGSSGTILVAAVRETMRLPAFMKSVPADKTVLVFLDPATSIGASAALLCAGFALRVALIGNAAFARAEPKRIQGKRALHGEADWMKLTEAAKLFPDAGGIVIGECYRVDKDSVGSQAFRADSAETWGVGGKSPLLCFDGSFGSSHGIVFAGSGGFKTTSVTIPTALKWGGTLIVLDPSNEVAPMVSVHRGGAGRDV
ncbi:conjugal transfer protein TraG, partial [Rhizobium leguminosarum bv. viciae]|nr:conjugal transfer protein TraG [Rhizobium leguminosarum bv. viciae]